MMYRLIPYLLASPFLLVGCLFSQTTKDEYLFRRQAKENLVLLRNEHRSVPVMNLEEPLALVSLGSNGLTPFQETIRYYVDCELINLSYSEADAQIAFSQLLRKHPRLIIIWRNPEGWRSLPQRLKEKWQAAVQDDIDRYQMARIIVVGSNETLNMFPGLASASSLLLTGGVSRIHEQLAAQVLMGAESCYGRLKQDVSRFFLRGNGLRLNGGLRLTYSPPETVGWDGNDLTLVIDSIVQKGIDQLAYPGCQVLVARQGHVVFHRSYGYHTYDKTIEVSDLDLYDLASITKVTAPLPILMKMVDDAEIDLDIPMAAYWPDFYKSDKGQITLREVLSHQAGLTPYITFYKQVTRTDGSFKWRSIKSARSATYPTKVYERMYLHNRWKKKMMRGIRDSDLETPGEYNYSGLAFLVFPDMLFSLTGLPMDLYLQQTFFSPLGAGRICFNPVSKVGLESIVPTEFDSVFRKTLVHGYVHDENAALLGGVSGNAGLFANSHDLAKLLQMYLNKGYYGGIQYLSSEVVDEFTSAHYNGNPRGLGFDKPRPEGTGYSHASHMASESSYGHYGFTGTFFWVDPKEELILIFLSNRVFPTRKNGLLRSLQIRESLLDACYQIKPVSW